ncbi:GDP-mannose 4,6-dehydratase [Flagellimonas sp.]|uniref:GDP-mannose 4,6-dehydratase n=1 Tax=Flagellimonas sp. TaxID=2058762 RepID=UPI003F49BA18
MGNPINGPVLITGIDGFTGNHLESFLLGHGFEVYGTTFSKPQKKNHLQCNILDFERLKEIISSVNPDYVIHLAAISFVASQEITRMYETNIIGTTNVLEALLELKIPVKKVVVASSAAVYGNVGEVLSEEMCPKPINHYGNSKLGMENMTANYFNSLDIIITRPFNYTGLGQESNFLVPKIVEHFKERKKTIALGNLNTFREYNDVNFLVESYCKLLSSDFRSGAVNISSGETYSIANILNLMEDISSHKMQIEVDERFVRKNEIVELKGSPEKLKQIIGEFDKKFSLRKTLKEMYIGE